MVQMATPWKHPKSGIYYLYRQIPEPLRAELGRRFHKETLGTRDPAEAARLFVIANARLQARLDEAAARVVAAERRDEISPERAGATVERWLRTRHKAGVFARWPSLAMTWWLEDTADRLFGGGVGAAPPAGEDAAERLVELRGAVLVGDRWLAAVRERPRSTWMQATRVVLDPLFETADPPIARSSANEQALMDAWNARVVEDGARLHADVDAPRAAGSKPRARPDLRLRELLADWARDRKPRPQSLLEATGAVADMIAFLGDVPVEALTSDMLMDYRDEARRLPATMPRADRTLPFSERVARHAATGAPRVAPETLKKRIGAIQALLGFAHEQRWITHNVGSGVKVAGCSRRGGRRRPFREDELARLFGSELFVRPDLLLRRRTAVSDVTLYWLFVLGCTSGGRIEELGQARLSDVRTDGGVLHIDIDDVTVDEPGDEPLPLKSLKTESSRRVVPIHDHALALGFERYVAALRALKQELLFPDLRPNSLGKLTQNASQRANRYIDRVVDPDPRLVFYSLRHRFKDEGREADVQERILDQLCGHEPATVGGRYGVGGSLNALKRSLDRLRFDSVGWAGLATAAAAIDWQSVAHEIVRRASR